MTLKDNTIAMENPIVHKETLDPGAMSEREEGEISDLDLEDVSDCSLTSNKSLKANNYTDRVKSFKSRDSLYFSCVSETDSDDNHFGCSMCRSYNCDGFQCTYSRPKRRAKNEITRKYSKYKCGRRKPRLIVQVPWEQNHEPDIKTSCVISSTTSDSDNDNVDRSLLVKLNKAVRVHSSHSDQFQTSLRSRLKNMVNHPSGRDESDSECELMELRKVALESKLKECYKIKKISEDDNEIKTVENCELDSNVDNKKLNASPESQEIEPKDDITDEEAQQLRMAALRSAILKKHKLRQQNKMNLPKENKDLKQQCSGVATEELDDDLDQIKTVINDLLEYIIQDNSSCESTQNEPILPDSHENIPEEIITESSTNVNDKSTPFNQNELSKTVEEDEDILRAMLLSSVSKKVSEKKVPPPENPIKTKINSKYKKIDGKKNNIVDIPVQRLIINVGDDSTDSETNTKPAVIPSQFEASLTQLLKEARANVEKQQSVVSNSNTSMPPALQSLPESRQAEYIQLKNRLDQLTKNQKLSNQIISATSSLSNIKRTINPTEIQKVPLKNLRLNRKNNRFTTSKHLGGVNRTANTTTTYINNKILTSASEHNKINQKPPPNYLKKSNSISASSNFITQKRFLEGKYKDLAPIVKKTKAARFARDQAGEEVTRLIEELKNARVRYNDCHQTYKNCIQEYLLLKSNIEAATTMENTKRPPEDLAPVKKKPKLQENLPLTGNIVTSESPLETGKISEKLLEKCKVAAVVKNTVLVNNIIIDKEKSEPTSCSKIDESTTNTKRRSIDTNPLIEICPFDLQGSCRDTDCKYRHLGNGTDQNQ